MPACQLHTLLGGVGFLVYRYYYSYRVYYHSLINVFSFDIFFDIDRMVPRQGLV